MAIVSCKHRQLSPLSFRVSKPWLDGHGVNHRHYAKEVSTALGSYFSTSTCRVDRHRNIDEEQFEDFRVVKQSRLLDILIECECRSAWVSKTTVSSVRQTVYTPDPASVLRLAWRLGIVFQIADRCEGSLFIPVLTLC